MQQPSTYKTKKIKETMQQHKVEEMVMMMMMAATVLTKASVNHKTLDQSALCVSGDGTFLSCNNLNVQNQENVESNANSSTRRKW